MYSPTETISRKRVNDCVYDDSDEYDYDDNDNSEFEDSSIIVISEKMSKNLKMTSDLDDINGICVKAIHKPISQPISQINPQQKNKPKLAITYPDSDVDIIYKAFLQTSNNNNFGIKSNSVPEPENNINLQNIEHIPVMLKMIGKLMLRVSDLEQNCKYITEINKKLSEENKKLNSKITDLEKSIGYNPTNKKYPTGFKQSAKCEQYKYNTDEFTDSDTDSEYDEKSLMKKNNKKSDKDNNNSQQQNYDINNIESIV
jgi:hypothetical protein